MKDLETAQTIRKIGDEPFVKASACLRLDFVFDANFSDRPGDAGPTLAEGLELFRERLTFYGGTGGADSFAHSQGRKPRAADLEQVADLTSLMARAEAASRIELDQRRQRLVDQGITPQDGPAWKARDFGTLFLADNFPEQLAENHLMIAADNDVRGTLGFGLDVYADHTDAILSLVEKFAEAGVYASGAFGFALNVLNNTPEDQDALHYQPPTRRFRLLNPVDVRGVRFCALDEQPQTGLYPIGAWYMVAKDQLAALEIPEDNLRKLQGKIYEVCEFEHAFLLKLYPEPILGDMNHDFDDGPARAACAALRKGFLAPDPGRLNGLRVGHAADRSAFYRRFLMAEKH